LAGITQRRWANAEAIRNHRPELCFSSEAAETLRRHRWPGNVRELPNAVERAVVLASGDTIMPEHLPDDLFRESSDSAMASAPKNIEEMEQELIVRVLGESPTLEDAAQTLGINASTLWRKRKRYKIE
jgi:NtrC-family two-component system response regulator AlgB